MSAEKTREKKANLMIHDEAGFMLSADTVKMYKQIMDDFQERKYTAGIDPYNTEEKYERRKLTTGE